MPTPEIILEGIDINFKASIKKPTGKDAEKSKPIITPKQEKKERHGRRKGGRSQ